METDSITTLCPFCAVQMQLTTIFGNNVYVCPKCGLKIPERDSASVG